MLGKYYRFHMYWVADQTLTYDSGARVSMRFLPWKFTSGALVYGTAITDDFGFGAGETIVTTGSVEATVIDNTSNLYLGGNGYFEVLADATSTDGDAFLYVEESDDNTNWPSDQIDFDITKHLKLIAVINFTTGTVDDDAAVNFWWGAK